METRQMTPFFSSSFSALFVTFTFVFQNDYSFLCGPFFGPFWSVKYLNIGQKLPIWTAHHTFLQNRHTEVTESPYYNLFPERSQKKVSAQVTSQGWRTQVSRVTTKWVFNWIRQHLSFVYQTDICIHSLIINISYQQLDWRIEISRPTKNCSYQSYSKICQLSRAERISSNIKSFDFIKVYEKLVLLEIIDFIETKHAYNKYQCGYCKNDLTATILSKFCI